MQLTQIQVDEYHERGYLILPAVFDKSEISKMAVEADRILDLTINTTLALGSRSGRLDVQLRRGKLNIRKVQPINDLSAYLCAVSNDERLIEPMRQLMAAEPILMEEKLNYKQIIHQPLDLEAFGATEFEDNFPLHHDWGYYRAQGYPTETMSSAVSIDESTTENGPLRIVPGTHARDWPMLNPDPASGDGRIDETLISQSERLPILAPAGSVMLFNSRLVHDSMPNNTGRPRRIMIYSHYPDYHHAEPDARNGPGRLACQAQEATYHAKVEAGTYANRFHASAEN